MPEAMTVNDEWWVRDATGQVLGPFTASAILATVQRGDAPASIEVSNDRVMWAGVMVHPGFRVATVPSPGAAALVAPPRSNVGRSRRILGAIVLAIIAFYIGSAWLETRGAMYYVFGTATSAYVTFTDEHGQRRELRVRLPWSSNGIAVPRGSQVLLSASSVGEGTVGCRINYDTDLVVEHRDADNVTTCAGFAGAR